MKLENIKIENFCSCNNITMQVSAFTPIIGYNNAGKSNILRAISWLLKKSVLPESKFFNTLLPVIVTGEISNVQLAALPANQQAQLQRYLTQGTLHFRRRQELPNVKASDIKIEVLDPGSGAWTTNPTGIDNAIGVLFPEPIFVEAMDDANSDIGQFSAKNTIGLLLKNAIEQSRSNNAAALAALTNALSAAATHLKGPTRIAELSALESSASAAVQSFFPGLQFHLELQSPSIEDVLKTATVELSEASGVKRSFSSFGHGTQRSVQMALINLLASQLRPTSQNQTTTVLLIDEPELYLHPHAIEILRESLETISRSGFQVVLTTHSPLLVDRHALDATIAFKNISGETEVRPKISTAAAILSNNPHQTAVVFSLQNSSYLLFSDHVLLVEGKTEKMLIPEIYEVIRGQSMGKNKTCLIEVSGSGSIAPTMDVLSAVGFQSKALVDLDYVFRQAPARIAGLVTMPSYIACENWFAANALGAGIGLAADGFPQSTQTMSAEAAFTLMASAMPQDVATLAHQLLAHNIWVWPRGAFENHLGIQKSNQARMAFLLTMSSTGNLLHATDSQGLASCMAWV